MGFEVNSAPRFAWRPHAVRLSGYMSVPSLSLGMSKALGAEIVKREKVVECDLKDVAFNQDSARAEGRILPHTAISSHYGVVSRPKTLTQAVRAPPWRIVIALGAPQVSRSEWHVFVQRRVDRVMFYLLQRFVMIRGL